ncbi:MAG TPA: serine/threonine-protein kinase [Gemmatimonadaceae bacterium]|nr:serine/threonine-protein kinase [Gemmatimonadaceae bacterium]
MISTDIPTPDPRTLDDASRPFAEAVAAQFAVKRLIGRGGMGVVFLARDRRLERLVALKTLPPALANDSAVRERFLRETRTAGALAHPNIVPIYGADEVSGFVFFVMSYVDGDSLAALTRDRGRLDARTVAKYMRDVAAALTHAHERGVIHRDVKAENILIDRTTDRALVTDFGVARVAEATPLTETGQVLGTVHYVSPEQVSGEVVDARSDIYSLGVVGFYALTGRFPFEAEVASAVLVHHVTKAAPPVASVNRDVPTGLAAIIDRCLMKSPSHRYQSADELRAALESSMPNLDVKPALVSDTTAHAIWQRASEMQAHTGIQQRPESVAKAKAASTKPKSNNPGYKIGEVVAAAAEAGIDERYVDRALAERGLGPDARPLPSRVAPVPNEAQPVRAPWWSVHRNDSVFRTQVKGEMPGRDMDRLLNVLREQTGEIGTTIARTRELAWHMYDPGSRLDVTVVPADGSTTIALHRSARKRLLAAILTPALTVGFFAGLATTAIFVDGMDEGALIPGFAAGLSALYATARSLFIRYRERNARQLAALGDVIATKVRESIGGKP